MELEHKSICGQLCQHPTCWTAQRLVNRGLRQITPESDDDESDHDEDGLPTQSVVNLLGNFGPDPDDRYPAFGTNQPSTCHLPSHSCSTTRNSYPKVHVPQATPVSVSGVRSSAGSASGKPAIHVTHVPPVSHVEVQEVFDLEDLRSDWQDTFKSRQYYVWVPKPSRNRPRRLSPLTGSAGRVRTGSGGPQRIKVKDKTEEMVPAEIARQRETRVLRKYVPPDRRSPTGGRPYAIRHSMSWLRREKNFGLYDLLELPRPILGLVLEQLGERDTITQEEVMYILRQFMPNTISKRIEEPDATSGLGDPELLQPRKMPLLDSSLKPMHSSRSNKTKRVYPGTEYSYTLLPDQPSPVDDPDIQHLYGEIKQSNSTLNPGEEYLQSTDVHGKHFLPAIPAGPKKPIRPITLGLTDPGAGVRSARPFTYIKGAEMAFSLGPLPTPPPPPSQHDSSPLCSPTSTEGAATLQVTIPSARSEQEGRSAPQDDPLPLDLHKTNLKCPSETPNPVGLSSGHVGEDQRAAFLSQRNPEGEVDQLKSPRSQASSGATARASAQGSIQETNQAVVDPILTLAQLPQSSGNRSVRFATDLPLTASGAPPPQPPSSPNNSNRSGTPPMSVQQMKHHLEGGNPLATAMGLAESGRDLIVVGKGSKVPSFDVKSPIVVPTPSMDPETPEPWPQVDEDAYRQSPTPPPVSTLTYSTVGQEHNRSWQSDPTPTALVKSVMHSSVVSIGFPSEPSIVSTGVASHKNQFTGAAASSHGARHEQLGPGPESSGLLSNPEKAKMMIGAGLMVGESPAPPPPSPEPKEQTSGYPHVNDALSALPVLDDVTETESVVTISAMPPNSLDDASRINTPHSLASSRLGPKSREGTMERMGMDTLHENESSMLEENDSSGNVDGKRIANDKEVHELDGPVITDVNTHNDNTDDQEDGHPKNPNVDPSESKPELGDQDNPMNSTDFSESQLDEKPLNSTGAKYAVPLDAVADFQSETMETPTSPVISTSMTTSADNRNGLEQFDITEESLKQELVEEYEKLSQQDELDKVE